MAAVPNSRPMAKLKKTPIQLVISSDPSASTSLHARPIGTPPPTSLRKPRGGLGDQTNNVDQTSATGSTSGFFPQISVEKCPEEDHDGDEDQFAFPATSNPVTGQIEPSLEDNWNSLSTSVISADNNNVITSSGIAGLSPPQRLRDGDGVVFELSNTNQAANKVIVSDIGDGQLDKVEDTKGNIDGK